MAKYVHKGANGNGNGGSWNDAWDDFDDINWGSIAPNETIYISGGTSKLVYTSDLNIGRPDITIERSEEAGHDGIVIIFGGRRNHLPHSFDPGWSESGSGQNTSAVKFNANDNVTLDGRIMGGITIHGWNTHGIQLGADANGCLIRNVDVYSCGERTGSNGSWRTDHHGINLTSNNTVENCWIHICGQDGIQSGSGNFDNVTVRNNWLSNEIAHKTKPRIAWNYREHPDGVQSFRPSSNTVIEDNLFGPGWWHAIIMNDTNANTNNASVKRNTFHGNNTNIRWNGKGNAYNCDVYDNIFNKWGTQFDDNGNQSTGGQTFYLAGTGHDHQRNVFANGGDVAIQSGTGAHTWTQNVKTNANFTGTSIPASQVVNYSGLFASPGQDGRSSGHNIANNWKNFDLSITNGNVVNIGATYHSPQEWWHDVTGIKYIDFPMSAHATDSNYARFKELGDQTGSTDTTFSYTPSVYNPDGNSVQWGENGLPNGLTMNPSSGAISGQPTNNGTFTVLVTVTTNGRSISGEFDIVVSGSGGGNVAPDVTSPGTRNNQVGDSVSLQINATDPNGDTLTFEETNLPDGLSLNQATGLITGSPTTVQSRTVTITARDTGGAEDSATFVWNITQSGGGGGGGTATFDALLDGKVGSSGAGLTQTYNLGPVANTGQDLIITQLVRPAAGESFQGNPSLNGNVYGYSQFACGGNSGEANTNYRYNEVVLSSNFPLESLEWGIVGITNPAEDVTSLTNGGQATNLGPADTGRAAWSNLGGVSQVSFVYASDSGGNNSAFGPVDSDVVIQLPSDNAAPVVQAINDRADNLGDSISFQVVATDADNNPLTYSIANQPSGISIDPNSGIVSGVADTAGVYNNVQVTADDGNGGADTESFNWTINDTANNAAPVINAIGSQTSILGQAASLPIVSSDADGDTLLYSATGLPSGLEVGNANERNSVDIATGNITSETSTTIVYDYGTMLDGLPLIVTMTAEGIGANPGNPSHVVAATLGGLPDFESGGAAAYPTYKVTRFTLSFNRRYSGNFYWHAYDVDNADDGNGNIGELLTNFSDGGSSGAQADNTLTLLSWPVLRNVTGVSFEWHSAASGNHAGFGPASQFLNCYFGPNNGIISGVPDAIGSYQTQVTADDGNGGIDTKTFNWDIVNPPANNAPQIDSIANKTNVEGVAISDDVTAVDADGDNIDISLTGLPTGLNQLASVADNSLDLSTATLAEETNSWVRYSYGQMNNGQPLEVVMKLAGVGAEPSEPFHRIGNLMGGLPRVHGNGTAPFGTVISMLVELEFSQPINGSWQWGVYGLEPTFNGPNRSEDILNISNGGTLVGTYGYSDYQVVDWSNLVNVERLTFEYRFVWNGHNAGIGSYGNGVVQVGTNRVVIGGTPTAAGNYTVTVDAIDNKSGTDQTTFLWDIEPSGTNAPPTITNPGNQIDQEGQQVTLQISADDPESGALGYEATGLPQGLSIDPQSGLISGTPTQPGNYAVVVTVTDDNSQSAEAGFSWQILAAQANQPPVVIVPGTITRQVNTQVAIQAQVSDAPSDTHTWAAQNLPTGLSIDNQTGLISGVPTVVQSKTVIITATDNGGLTGDKTVTFNIVNQIIAEFYVQVVDVAEAALNPEGFKPVVIVDSTKNTDAHRDVKVIPLP